jgi:nicotinate-nucleotide adenylyltransferase
MTGLFGGTFNPIHVGHLQAARDVADALDLDRVVFIPNAQPPHKDTAPVAPEDRIAPAEHRFAWVAAAIADEPRFDVSRCEIDRDGPSYLVDTLAELTAGRAGDFVFIVGQDAFREMGDWRAPRELFAACCWAVCTRPPLLEGHLDDWLPEVAQDDFEIAADGRSARHRTAATWIRLVEITPVDVSASQLRAALFAGGAEARSVEGWLPEAIRDAVRESGCYTTGPANVDPPHSASADASVSRRDSKPATPAQENPR